MSEAENLIFPLLESNYSHLSIRYASLDDVSAIHHVTQAAYAEYRALIPYSSIWLETPEIIANEMQLGPVLLVIVDDKIVGSVRCHVEQEAGRGDFMYIHRLAVHPDYRRQRLGYALMQAVEALAESKNINRVRLETRAAQPENYRFYRKLGYQLGEISLYLEDGSPRAYWMSKDLVLVRKMALVGG